MTGFIKLHRVMLDWGWYSDPIVKTVFIHLLLTASYRDGTFLGEPVKAGQVVTGRKKLADELGLGEQQVRTALNRLEQTGEITKKSTNKKTVITIEKWHLYQGDSELPNQQLTNNQPTTNQQLTTIQEGKKVKNVKKVKKVKKVINNNITPLPPFAEYGEQLQEATSRWLAYKRERGQDYKQVGLETLLKKIKTMSDRFGEPAVIDLIDECIANRYQGIIWDRLKRSKPEDFLEDSYRMMEEWLEERNE